MRNELLDKAEEALIKKDGKTLVETADSALDEDENDAQAWLYLMRSFELLLPLESCKSSNEITCGRNAIEAADFENREAIIKEVYMYYLKRMLAVFRHDEKILADAKEIAGSFQKHHYFDATHAGELTYKEDEPFIHAVLSSFTYAFELFDEIDEAWLKKDDQLKAMCEKLAYQWQRTYSYLEIRYEFYRKRLSDESIEWGLLQYGRLLKHVENKTEIIRKKVAFNLLDLDQTHYLR